jgi:flagellar assembly protein FliH
MIRALTLEDFAPADISPPSAPVAEAAPQEAALDAFDEGYRNGWEDCAKAEAESHRRIAADLATNLRDLSLTYAEARSDILACLAPLFEDIAAQLLPALAAEAIAPAVIAELQDAARSGSAPRATLIAAPAALPALERLVEAQETLEIDLKPEPAYADGQVSLRFGDTRRDIDLTGAAGRMADAIRSFVAQETGQALPDTLRKGAA